MTSREHYACDLAIITLTVSLRSALGYCVTRHKARLIHWPCGQFSKSLSHASTSGGKSIWRVSHTL